MNTKRCIDCGKELELTAFYAHPQMKDGHLNACKECCKRRERSYRFDPIRRERIRAYDKVRGFRSGRKAKDRDLLKYKAHYLVHNAIRDEKLIPQPCEICGDPKVQAHHDDYSKPLKVRWFCFRDHREVMHGQIVGAIPF